MPWKMKTFSVNLSVNSVSVAWFSYLFKNKANSLNTFSSAKICAACARNKGVADLAAHVDAEPPRDAVILDALRRPGELPLVLPAVPVARVQQVISYGQNSFEEESSYDKGHHRRRRNKNDGPRD